MADIIVYDRDGKKVEKIGIETLELDTTTEGETTIFTHGIAVENLPIEVDFSNGDMEIDGGGYLVKSAVILKPENLIPDNIADGENVAGVVGTHKGGGGGGAQIAIGTIEPTTQIATITHGLGVVPSYIIFSTNFNYAGLGSVGNSDIITFIATNSNKVTDPNKMIKVITTKNLSSEILQQNSAAYDITAAGTLFSGIHSADSQTFKAGTETLKCVVGRPYYWIALA